MITQITYHTSPSCLQTIPPKQVKDVFFSFHGQCLFIDYDLCVPFLVSIYLFTYQPMCDTSVKNTFSISLCFFLNFDTKTIDKY